MLNKKLSDLQLNRFKSGFKNKTEVTLNLSPNLIGNSSKESNFQHKLLLTDTQVSIIRTALGNDSSVNIKLSKPQFSKSVQLGRFLFGAPNIFDPPLIRNIKSLENPRITSFVKEFKDASAKKINKDTFVNAGLNIISKKTKKGILSFTGSGIIITNSKIKDIIKLIESPENRGILFKGTTTKITSQEGGFLNFLGH